MSETSDLTGPLLRMYKQAGALAFRMQAGRIQVGAHWVHLAESGTADILVFSRSGRIIWVETKDPTGSTKKSRREQQDAFRARVEGFGHRYLKVKTISEGMAALD